VTTVAVVELTAGTVAIRTDVTGSAARMGHRLVIEVQQWAIEVEMAGDTPAAVTFRANLPSLRVVSGSGGLTPLTPVDKQVILRNAGKTLDSKNHPEVTFVSESVEVTGDRVALRGALTIHGVTQPLTAEVAVDQGLATASIPVRQSDFGVKAYSLMLGQLKVADEVVVTLEVELPTGLL
jgi:polyisoprenoid-binding protein YceI